jgi:hypothetical protein
MMIAFIAFHFLYMVVFTRNHIVRLLLRYGKHIKTETFIAIYRWIMEFRPVLLISAYLIVLTTLVFVTIPLVAMMFASRRNRRLERVKAIADNL